ncbi:uncharacterized protein [Argopecten irradians]|uniref:uncharacterized protein n=1 Tax=Argopecten irradians TaxID=31199 RepID=UPI00372213C8
MNNTLRNSTPNNEPLSLTINQSVALWSISVGAVFAIAEHSTILLLTCMSKTLRQKPFVVSILLLSYSDILLGLALLLSSLINLASLRQTWLCGSLCFLQQLGLILSLVHTLVICIERYLSTRPIQMRTFSVGKRQLLTVISMGICSLILGIPYLFTVKEATVVLPCTTVTLFQKNRLYTVMPVRSLSFLIWICTVIVYGATAKNIRNAQRRTEQLRGYSTHRNGINAERIHQKYGNGRIAHMSPLTRDADDIGASTSTETNKPGLNSKSNFGDQCIAKSSSGNIIIKSDFGTRGTLLTISENRIQNDEKNVAYTQNATGVNKRKECTIETDQIENISAKQNIIRPKPSTDISNDTDSCFKSVRFQRQTNSKLPPPAPEMKAFRIVSVVFLVFLITMTPQCVAGLVMIFFPVSQKVDFTFNLLAVSSIVTNPFMYAFLLKDFRKILRCN